MNPEERSLLERTYKLSQENNDILKSLRRSNRISMIIKAFYWILIIALSVGSIYFIQPFINSLAGALGVDKESTTSGVSSTKSYAENILDLLK